MVSRKVNLPFENETPGNLPGAVAADPIGRPVNVGDLGSGAGGIRMDQSGRRIYAAAAAIVKVWHPSGVYMPDAV